MRVSLPDSAVAEGHDDYHRLASLEVEILRRLDGLKGVRANIPTLFRDCIDDVMQTAKTGRRSYAELEKTEKTYIGTRIEIGLRSLLGVPRRKLDLLLLGEDVDVKHTMGANWMIPGEALGHVCILMAADEKKALCYMGLFLARPEYLSISNNQDKKRTLSAEGFRHIKWLLRAVPYPANFWRSVSAASIEAIASGRTGNDRLKALFREVQERPIIRRVIEEAAAPQKDFMRRIRKDGNGRSGTRGDLAREGILVLSGKYNQALIRALDLPTTGPSDFISRTVRNEDEARLARLNGFNVPWPVIFDLEVGEF
jgi:hypothetical protein